MALATRSGRRGFTRSADGSLHGRPPPPGISKIQARKFQARASGIRLRVHAQLLPDAGQLLGEVLAELIRERAEVAGFPEVFEAPRQLEGVVGREVAGRAAQMVRGPLE